LATDGLGLGLDMSGLGLGLNIGLDTYGLGLGLPGLDNIPAPLYAELQVFTTGDFRFIMLTYISRHNTLDKK